MMVEAAVIIVGSVVGAYLIHLAVNLHISINRKGD